MSGDPANRTSTSRIPDPVSTTKANREATPDYPHCNTPDVTFHLCNSNSCHFRLCDMIFPPWLGFVFCFAFYSCHACHIMSSCASHLHTCSSMHPSIFPVVRFAIRHSHMHRRTPLVSFSCAGVEHSRNGPSLAKWPWYSTGRPPVKFRVIWSSFGTPTAIRISAKASFKLQPNTPPKQPNNPSNSPPCSLSFDHDRVGENRTSFGHP